MSTLMPGGVRRLARAAAASAALIAASACNRAAEQPKVPLNASTSGSASSGQANPHEQLAPEARVALDSGNVAFRAGKYELALAQYRAAAKAEGKSSAPFYGIYMVAQKLGNKTLADSVMAVIRDRSGAGNALTDTAMAKMHNVAKAKPSI